MVKISVITICLNEPNLEKTCESIVNQTYQDFEWIVIDGGSNQETIAVFEKYKHRIKTFISEKDSGIYNAMNKGINLAKGEYLHFLNAGDYYSNENILQKVIDSGLNKDIVCGDSITTDEGAEKLIISPDKVDFKFLKFDSLPHQSSFIKKELFSKFGFYDESYKIAGDWEKWIVFILLHHCTYKHINVAVSVYNLSGISSKCRDLSIKERKGVLAKYFPEDDIMTYNFWEQLFSIKNNPTKTKKIITILGIKFKIKK